MATVPHTEFPRRYLSADADFSQWPVAEFYYQELLDRPIETADKLEQWLIDASELDAAIGEARAQCYTAMTCATDDPQRKQAYLHFVENIDPNREPWEFKLQQKFVAAAEQFELPPQRYEVLLRGARNAIELFREENIPLLTAEAKLEQQYQEITGGLTVSYDERELTMPQLARYLEEPDRQVREQTWRLYADRYLQEAEALDRLYDEMVALRTRIARQAGCDDYRAWAFKAKQRFDYRPEDCLAFHEAIAAVVVPAVERLADERRRKLGVERLRPWDLEVDPDSRPPLKPFANVDELVAGCRRIFDKVHPELGAQFERMRADGLLDLDSRKGKAPGGYQAVYQERRLPFIFMNAVGTESDVRTLLHEGGHAFHTFACRQEPFLPYRHAPMEFAEVASMAMECLAVPHLEEFYGDDANRARKRFFGKIVNFLPWMARVDAFQHRIYTEPELDIEQRKDYWQELTQRFAGHIDYADLELFDRHSWHQKLHFFQVPFYYVEYGIAQLGALQVWLNSRKNFDEAVAFYRNGLALGGSRPLPELFEAAGGKFDFSEQTLRPLIDAVMEEIERL